MPQLDPTWFASQLFWLAITFLALYVVLARYVLPPLMEVMARRQQTVENDVEQAQHLQTEAQNAKQEYEKALTEARGRAQTLMSDATVTLKKAGEQKTKEMDLQIATKLQQAAQQISAKKLQMMAELEPTATELTTLIVEKLTQLSPSADKVVRAINEVKGNS